MIIRNVTVYLSSSSNVADVYKNSAKELGRAIALQGWGVVYGGNNLGMMGLLADAAREAGGKVIGVTPQLFVDQDCADSRCDELIVSSSIRHRKEIMEHRGSALVALPGGLGTLEEIFEVIVGRFLGLHDKPIVLLNIAGFYDPLLAMIDKGIEQHFIRSKAKLTFTVCKDVNATIEYLLAEQAESRKSAVKIDR